MKIAILYICTGIYDNFWPEFYESSENNLFKNEASIEYFVFTDSINIKENNKVHKIFKKFEGFPLDSLLRFEMFLKIKDQLKKFDFILFFNSNAQILKPIALKEILPDNNYNLVGAQWPILNKLFKLPVFFPYEHRKASTAYISPWSKGSFKYYMGGLNGGFSEAYLNMCEELSANIKKDLEKGIIALVHDESHLNKYFRNHKCKSLTPEYCMPQEWISANLQPKIIFREKTCIDPYFNKNRDNSIKGKVKKALSKIWHAFNWYI